MMSGDPATRGRFSSPSVCGTRKSRISRTPAAVNAARVKGRSADGSRSKYIPDRCSAISSALNRKCRRYRSKNEPSEITAVMEEPLTSAIVVMVC